MGGADVLMADSARLIFVDEGQPDVADVGHFMFLYGGVYAAAVSQLHRRDVERRLGLPLIEKRLRRHLDSLALIDTGALFSQDLHAGELTVKRLAVESPLEIVMCGVGAALALAVILSGGTIKFDAESGAFEATMPALGEGIRKLREALAQKTPASLGYGVRPFSVKLSKSEVMELMKFDPASEKKGGFQRVLIGMQYRINHTTRKLELLPHDVDVILKYGRQPKKGGWQASIRKIFGQHFNLTNEP